MRRLVQALEDIGKGDFRVRMELAEAPGTPPEVVAAFNAMAAALEARKNQPDRSQIDCRQRIAELETILAERTGELQQARHRFLRELSDRVHTEKELIRLERDWQTIFEAIGHPIVILDREFKILAANRKARETTAHLPGGILGRPCYEVFHGPNVAEPVRDCPARKLLRTGDPQVDEMEMETAGGTFLVSCSALLDHDGGVHRIIHASTDVTALKQAQRTLQETNRNLEIEAARRGEVETKMRRLNRALGAMYRCNQAVLRATDERELLDSICRLVTEVGGYRLAWVGFAEQDPERSVRPVARAGPDTSYLDSIKISWADNEWGRGPTGTAIRTGKPVVARDLSTTSGYDPWKSAAARHRFASSVALPLAYQEETYGALNIYSDAVDVFEPDEMELLEGLAADLAFAVTALRTLAAKEKAEERMKRAKELLQTVLDGISEPIVVLDAAHRVRLLNREALGYYGLENFQAAVGQTCDQVLCRTEEACKSLRLLQADGLQRMTTLDRPSPANPALQERVFAYPVSIENREPAVILRIRDITRELTAQRQIIHNEKLAALGLLVSGICHEINNPNSFISFNLPILRQYVEELVRMADFHAVDHPAMEIGNMSYGEFVQDVFRLMENMEHGSRRINQTVRGLRDFIGQREGLRKSRVHLEDVIEKSVMMCRSELEKHGAELRIEIPPALLPFSTDPDALEQVLVNLLINAAHAGERGGSRIRLRVETLIGERRQAIISVEDNGCGMDEETRGRIFDPFFSTKPPQMGTGLGLYVCQTLVEGLGGQIKVESTPGKGTLFRVILNE